MSWATHAGRVLLGVLVVGNATATWRNRSPFPFCSYNMFFGVVPPEYPQLRVRLLWEGRDGPGEVLDTRGLLPFEFFRTVSLLETGFDPAVKEAERTALAASICDGLNYHPWSARDEVAGSLRQAGEPLILGFDLLVMMTSADRPWRMQTSEAERFTVLHSYRRGSDDRA